MTVFTVNSTDDILTPPPGIVTLRSAIQAANASPGADTINIPNVGTYKITTVGTATNNTAGELDIAGGDGLTIRNTSGGTVTIDGSGLNRVFAINPTVGKPAATDTFVGLTITNGVSPGGGDGGGILLAGQDNLVLQESVVTGNLSSGSGGGIDADGTGKLTLVGTQVVGNNASQSGGGIDGNGSGLVTISGQSLVVFNTARGDQGGGGISIRQGTLQITGSTVRGNRALVGPGGGILAIGAGANQGGVQMNGGIVEENTAAEGGGGYFADGVAGAQIVNSFFLENTAIGNGGGLAADKGFIQIQNTNFTNNAAQNGGGVDVWAAANPAIADSQFYGNVAANTGGAISDEGSVEATFFKMTIQGNRALGMGGALAAITTGDVTINNLLFLDNTASGAGGAITISGGSLQVFGARFSGNAASNGGALNITPNSFTIQSSTFDHNRSAFDGGAMVLGLVSSNNFLTNDTIAFNQAGGIAAGLDLSSGSGLLTMTGDTIDNNAAGSVGGGVVQDSTNRVSIGGTIIGRNTANGISSDYTYQTGILNDAGFNDIENPTGDGNKFGPTSIFLDPKLGPLVDNGGITAGAPASSQVIPTQALFPGSPAIHTGPAGLTTDERGFARPAAHPSMGAYEPQYAANATANQVFVENLYEVLLNRAADSGGLAGGTNFLNAGGSPTALAQALEGSSEYLGLEANQLVRRYLDRTPSAAEVTNVTAFLTAGHTPEQAAAIFINSPEFAADYGNDQDTFIEALYQTVLGRAADSIEVASWDATVAAGLARPAMVNLFLTSDGYLSDLIAADFEAYLGRAPRPSEAAACLAAMHAGFSDASLAALVLGTAESFAART